MATLNSSLMIELVPVAIGLLWSIQTIGIGYILIFYLLHEFYLTTRIKIFGKVTNGVITATSQQKQQQNNNSTNNDYFIHYCFQLNPGYAHPSWNGKLKVPKSYFESCQKGQILEIIYDPISRNSDFYYAGYRKQLCSKWEFFCFLLILPFPFTSILTAIYYSFHFSLISGFCCIGFGVVVSVPVCIYFCKRRNTFCYTFKWNDDEIIEHVHEHINMSKAKRRSSHSFGDTTSNIAYSDDIDIELGHFDHQQQQFSASPRLNLSRYKIREYVQTDTEITDGNVTESETEMLKICNNVTEKRKLMRTQMPLHITNGIITPANTEKLTSSKNKNNNPFADDMKTMITHQTGVTCTDSTVPTLPPDVSPYIIDDGIQSFTANTADLYANTSVKYAKSGVTMTSTTQISSTNGRNKAHKRVITPIAVKYLIDHHSQKKIKINIDSINHRDRNLNNSNPFRTATV